MKKLLGANWDTTVLGWIAVLAVAIAADPKLVAFMPDPTEPYIVGICKLIAVIAGGAFAYQVKSRNVTGGTIQQTARGDVASYSSQEQSSSVIETKQATSRK